MLKENAKENRESWRVVRLPESDEVSVSEDRGLKRSTADVVEEPQSLR
jgi:hypothetical protein